MYIDNVTSETHTDTHAHCDLEMQTGSMQAHISGLAGRPMDQETPAEKFLAVASQAAGTGILNVKQACMLNRLPHGASKT